MEIINQCLTPLNPHAPVTVAFIPPHEEKTTGFLGETGRPIPLQSSSMAEACDKMNNPRLKARASPLSGWDSEGPLTRWPPFLHRTSTGIADSPLMTRGFPGVLRHWRSAEILPCRASRSP